MYVRGETIPIAKVQRKKKNPKRQNKIISFCPAGKHQGRENNSQENRIFQQTQNEDKTPQPKLLQRSLPFTAEKFANFTCEVVSKDASILLSGPQRLYFPDLGCQLRDLFRQVVYRV
jgi:hypothetical protein